MTVRALESAYRALEAAHSMLRGAINSQLLELDSARTSVHRVARDITNEAKRHDLSFEEALVLGFHAFDGPEYEDDVVVCDAARRVLKAAGQALALLASDGCARETSRVVGDIANVCKLAEEDLTIVVDLIRREEADAPNSGSQVPYVAEELEHRWQAILELLEVSESAEPTSAVLLAAIRDMTDLLPSTGPTQARKGESEQIADG